MRIFQTDLELLTSIASQLHWQLSRNALRASFISRLNASPSQIESRRRFVARLRFQSTDSRAWVDSTEVDRCSLYGRPPGRGGEYHVPEVGQR